MSNIFSPKFDVALLADLLDIFDDNEVSERLFCLYIFKLDRVDEEVIFRRLFVDDGFWEGLRELWDNVPPWWWCWSGWLGVDMVLPIDN